eukprot:IDg5329t1
MARNVQEWVFFTKQRAKSVEKVSAANLAIMGYLLFHSVHPDYKSVPHHARDSNDLELGEGADQEEAVKKFIKLVGQDSLIEGYEPDSVSLQENARTHPQAERIFFEIRCSLLQSSIRIYGASQHQLEGERLSADFHGLAAKCKPR